MKLNAFLATSAIVLALGLQAQAAQVAALIGNDTIAIVDTDAKKATKSMKIAGLSGALVGIDVRPADGMLYGLTTDGTVYTIAPDGKATMKSKLEMMLPAGVMATVDFNPVADRLRVIGSDGTSLRVNVDDGKVTKDGSLKFADGDANKDKTPKVIAGAYSNSVKGTKETALYDIEATTGSLVRQAPPNDGILNTIGIARRQSSKISRSTSGRTAPRTKPGRWPTVSCGRSILPAARRRLRRKIEGVTGVVKDIAILPAM